MLAANYSSLRKNLKSYCDSVTDNNEILLVTRKDDKHLVMMSLEEFSRYERAMRNIAYIRKIEEGLAQVAAGTCKPHEIIEVE